MKNKLKGIWNHIFNICLLFVFFASAAWSVAIAVVLPKFGLSILLLSIGWYGIYSYLNKKED